MDAGPRNTETHPPTMKAADGKTTLHRFYVEAVVYAPSAISANERLEQATGLYLDDAKVVGSLGGEGLAHPGFKVAVYGHGDETPIEEFVVSAGNARAAVCRILNQQGANLASSSDTDDDGLVARCDESGEAHFRAVPEGSVFVAPLCPSDEEERGLLRDAGIIGSQAAV